jgi:hypothetical protein
MRFDGSFGRTQQVGDLLVKFAGDHQREDFGLTGGQRRDKRPKGINLVLAPLRRRIAGKRAFDRVEQWFPGHGFGQEVFRTGLDGAHAHGDIPMTCHEDNGPVAGQLSKLLLKLQATQGWHLDVEDDATRSGISDRTQEASRGLIFRDFVTGQFQQSRDRLTKRRVVVNDVNYWGASHRFLPLAIGRPDDCNSRRGADTQYQRGRQEPEPHNSSGLREPSTRTARPDPGAVTIVPNMTERYRQARRSLCFIFRLLRDFA